VNVVRIHPTQPGLIEPPPDRGQLLAPAEVVELVGGVSEAWVRKYVPHRVALGHRTVRWYKGDVRAWLESRREQ